MKSLANYLEIAGCIGVGFLASCFWLFVGAVIILPPIGCGVDLIQMGYVDAVVIGVFLILLGLAIAVIFVSVTIHLWRNA